MSISKKIESHRLPNFAGIDILISVLFNCLNLFFSCRGRDKLFGDYVIKLFEITSDVSDSAHAKSWFVFKSSNKTLVIEFSIMFVIP